MLMYGHGNCHLGEGNMILFDGYSTLNNMGKLIAWINMNWW